MYLLPALAAVYLIWGSTYLGIRFAIETIPPFLMAGSRLFISGLILYLWTRGRGAPKPTWLEWKSATIVGFFLLLGGNGLVVWSEQFVPSGLTSLLVATAPIWMVVIDWCLPTGQKFSPTVLVGILIGFGGVIFLINPSHLTEHAINTRGIVGLMVAAFLWAIGSLYARRAKLPKSAFTGIAMEMIAGGALLLLLGGLTNEMQAFSLANISTRSWISFIYLTLIGSLVGFTAYVWVLNNASVALASTYAYINPLIALILGWWLGNEAITPQILFGALLILVGVSTITLSQSRRKNA